MNQAALNQSPAVEQSVNVAEIYTQRRTQFDERERLASRQAQRFAHGRVILFLLAALTAILSFAGPPAAGGWIYATVLLFAGFLYMVARHRSIEGEARHWADLRRTNENALARLARQWDRFPLPTVPATSADDRFATDLNLLGRASLYQLVSMAGTHHGLATLRDWLLEPAAAEELAARQQSVAELAPALDFRQELHVRGLALARRNVDPHGFLDWAEGPAWLVDRPVLRVLSWILPIVQLAVLGAYFAGQLPITAWLVALAVNLMTGYGSAARIHEVFNRISSRHSEISEYLELFRHAEELPSESQLTAEIRETLIHPGRGACAELDRLRRIMEVANLRFSQMAHSIAVALLLVDLHVLAAAERWQARCGSDVRRWFEQLGRLEALASLAGLAHDEPDWVYPQVDPGCDKLEAAELGHPLLASGKRVANDVTVGPPGTLLLVTGSNMSGKSTLLRALGANCVLAQCGAPVCANRLTMMPVALATSMRVQDSLEDGVSLFMAELERLKETVDLARQYRGSSDRRLLYLLDEILQGTNTAERQIAVVRVLSHLLKEGAIGAVSTHDLELAALPTLAQQCQTVHFRESFEPTANGEQMTFDYQLRPGISTTTNALKLLELVGLDDES